MIAAGLTAALAVPTALLTAAPAGAAPAPMVAAAPGDFTTSFETAEAVQAFNSTVELAADGNPVQDNVTGTSAGLAGSLLESVAAVTASAENAPGELAINLTDLNTGTKWLAFVSSGWVRYQLDAPAAVVKYSLTSANDAPERDPKDWIIQGSNDGTSWTDLDTRTGVTFPARFATQEYSFTNTTAYLYYRLNVTSNGSGGLIQLADWDISDGSDTHGADTPMVTAVGNGPISGYNIKPLTGFSGLSALRYSGGHSADGRGFATNKLFDVNIPVGATSRLSYKIFPELTGGDLQYPSTFAAVDLHFTDGSYLSQLEARDAHGYRQSAAGQGAGKILYADQWNAVQTELGKVAGGRTIDRILISYDNTAATTETRFQGWLDDLAITATPTAIDAASLTNFVDTRRGTNSSGSFSRGNNLPISALPNGFTFWTPATNANSQSWQYYYHQGNNSENRPVLQGLNVSHEPSPWMGDRNQLSVMPSAATGVPTGSASGRGLSFGHETEIAQPDYYKVDLATGIKAEMAPADHGGILRFSFDEASTSGHVVLDTVDNNGAFTVDAAAGTVSGWIDNGSGLSAGRSRMFVYGTFDRAATGSGIAPNGHTGTTYATFDTSTAKQVELRLATSFISLDQAKANHGFELAGRGFDEIRSAAQQLWNKRLGIFEVEGANETSLVTLYSNLYRLNLYPNSQFENTGTAEAPRYQYASPVAEKTGTATDTATNAKLVDGKIYVNNGFWDTYRTVWPAYSLLYPEVAAEIADGFVQQYRDAGWIARWSSPGYADLMTGTSSDVSFADAYLKGVALPDPLSTYDAALRNATNLSGRSAVGRKGLDSSIFLGYTSSNTGESVSWALEGFINDYGIGNMAAALAEDPATPESRRGQLKEESAYFLQRAQNYVQMFNPESGFFQGRTESGAFTPAAADFDPESWGGFFTETNAWNFAFHAPQDGAGLANLFGGRAGLESRMDEFFSTPETAGKPGGYGGVIHEMIEARDVRLGQLGMSNQVSHHIPYMYNFAGAPAKSAKVVREILQRLYVGSEIGQGYPGDEDNGEMSAWYLLSALGIYPLQVGSENYTVGSPLFTKATVHRTQGDLVVNAPANSVDNVYVQGLSVNGTAQTSTSIPHTALAGAATLDFAMGAAPSTWGTAVADAPPSLTTGDQAPKPLQDVTGPNQGTGHGLGGAEVADLFDDTSRTQVAFADGAPQITYTLAGSAQNVTFYTLTSGADPGDPADWVLQGSTDGTTWTDLDSRTGQVFTWRNQTRPFQVATPGVFSQYRLTVTKTAGAATANLAEIELMAPDGGATGGPIRVTAGKDLAGAQGVEIAGTLAVFGGGLGKKPADYTATVDWNDGGPTSTGTITAGRLGNYTVSGSHTFTKPGVYRVVVTVSDGTTSASATVLVVVSYALAPPMVDGFDSVCIGDEGAAPPCDADEASLSRAALAVAGASPGKPIVVPGTDLSFVLPVIPPGEPDNATGAGQTLQLSVPADATTISLIGTGTQRDQDTVGTLNYTDGTSEPIAIQFGDWCGSAKFGNLVAVTTPYRLNGTGRDGCQAKLFATAPFSIPAGKTIQSLTMPTQTGDPASAGRVHVFAVADNGSAVSLTAGPDATVKTGSAAAITVGTVTGGVPGAAGYSATVQWGDGSIPEPVTVSAVDANGVATITGTHTFLEPGSYSVWVMAADSRASVVGSFTVTAQDKPTYSPTITVEPAEVLAGAKFTVTGSGFAPYESVRVKLGSGPKGKQDSVSLMVKADASGSFATTITVPKKTRPGVYAVTATGTKSKVPASATITVTEPAPPHVYRPVVELSSDSGPRGDVIRVDARGFAKNERVVVTLDGRGLPLGIAKANADGVVTDMRVRIPFLAATGKHKLVFTGSTSKAKGEAMFTITGKRQWSAPVGGSKSSVPGAAGKPGVPVLTSSAPATPGPTPGG